jgi:hypothetical protein
MSRILRDLSTDQSRSFWESAERSAAEVQSWPSWKRAGINVADVRDAPREEPELDLAAEPPADK